MFEDSRLRPLEERECHSNALYGLKASYASLKVKHAPLNEASGQKTDQQLRFASRVKCHEYHLLTLTYLSLKKGRTNSQPLRPLGCCCCTRLLQLRNLSGKYTIKNRAWVGPSKTTPAFTKIIAIFATVFCEGRVRARLCLGNPTFAFQQHLLANSSQMLQALCNLCRMKGQTDFIFFRMKAFKSAGAFQK